MMKITIIDTKYLLIITILFDMTARIDVITWLLIHCVEGI